MLEFRFRLLTAEDAAAICAWRYPPPLDFYSYGLATEASFKRLMRPEHNYHAILNEAGDLIGFFCYGPDARIPGWKYDDDALDFGIGLAPQLTRRGIGGKCVQAVIRQLEAIGPERPLRATIVAWNRGAIRLSAWAGFREAASFWAVGAGWFKVVVRNPR